MASLTITPASGSITAGKTHCRVDVAGATQNDDTAYNAANYPASPEVRYYLLFDAPAGTDDKRSYVFAVDENGGHSFNSFVFDAAGSWTVRLRKAADDSDVTTSAVTVS